MDTLPTTAVDDAINDPFMAGKVFLNFCALSDGLTDDRGNKIINFNFADDINLAIIINELL
jgi:hypothetical protein